MDAVERIAYLNKVANYDQELRFSKLYKIIHRVEFLEYAWQNIKNNKGSTTAGIDRTTRITIEDPIKLNNLLKELSNELITESYTPLPVRMVENDKKNGKGKRPLGIPTIKDRIVQSACKLILESIYEPVFLNVSHGFRPKRSCQTAVNDIVVRKYDCVIEGDIKGCFDNIQHGILLNILRERT